ncbi:ABC transporter ATP-binding protein [Catenuloplanes sp. NPDC051500]|uniref:ABC transporter ATP-binding protein n=1 Tax=Catenuloplanes sp. NPDC051500 TaxID=3363959 RepID=UPI0037BC8F32
MAVRGLRVVLGGTAVLDGVDLTVAAGEWVTIIGPNGAGKSTLLRALTGLVPYSGSISLGPIPADPGDSPDGTSRDSAPASPGVPQGGVPVGSVAPDRGVPVGSVAPDRGVPAGGIEVTALRRRDRARRVATVAQSPAVPPGMTVREYVLLGRTPYVPPLGRESAADLAVADEEIAALDLTALATRPLTTLSGGERQRAFLARALAQRAPLLLLDEPTSALDIGHQQDVLDLVDHLRRARGLTVLATMHDLSIAGEYADRMVLLAAGRVVAAGTPAEVLTEELLAVHYRARVRVLPGEHGPLVVPIR